MTQISPDGLAADQVHDGGDGWYIGAADGFRVGPFVSRRQAERHSRTLTQALACCASGTERVQTVRQFIIEQRLEHGRTVRGASTTGTDPATAPPQASAPPVRSGERERVWFRTQRVFAVADAWFFATREGLNIGPYPSRDAAREAAARLKEQLRGAADPESARRLVEAFAAGRDG